MKPNSKSDTIYQSKQNTVLTPETKSSPKKTIPVWKGPDIDGITFSLLSRFLQCRERFRLRTVYGYKEEIGFEPKMEYGSMWHEGEEAVAAHGDWRQAIKAYSNKLLETYGGSEEQIHNWTSICLTQFQIYVNHYSKDRSLKTRTPLLEEVSFKVPILLPSGRSVFLRGKFDCVFLQKSSASSKSPTIWLQENKTKGEIDEEGIGATLQMNLQAMIYQVALRQLARYSEETISKYQSNHPQFCDSLQQYAQNKMKIEGTLYNVVRRPLSDRYAIRQKKSETTRQFHSRLGEEIQANPKKYFLQWKAVISEKKIEEFQTKVLYPLLEQLCDWWEWIKVDPDNPWRLGNIHHFQYPWGTYHSLAGGFRGDFFNHLTKGTTRGMYVEKELFPEL